MTSTQTVTLAGLHFTYDGLYSLSGPELVKAHNLAAAKVGVQPTKRFGDKVSAVKRTWAVLQKVSEANGAVAEEPKAAPAEPKRVAAEPKPKKEAAPKKAKAAGTPRGKRFVFPQLSELEEPKKVREGTHRHTLVTLMSRREGATFEECLAATWGKEKDMDPATQEKTCYEAIRLIHYYTGYGMRQTETGERKGAIHLFFNEK